MTRLLYDVCLDHLREQRAEKERAAQLQQIKGQEVLDLFIKGALDGVHIAQCTLDVEEDGHLRYTIYFSAPGGGWAISSKSFQAVGGELEPAWDAVGWNAQNAAQKAARCGTFLDAAIFVLGITLEADNASST